MEGRRLPVAGEPTLPGVAVARRRRRHREARVRHLRQTVRRRRLQARRGEVVDQLAGRGHAVGRDRLRRGLADHLGLPADLQALAARHRARGGAGGLRGRGRGRCGRRQQLPHPVGALRRRAPHPRLLPRHPLPAVGRAAGQAGASRRRRDARHLRRPHAPQPADAVGGGRADLHRRGASGHRSRRLPRRLAPLRRPLRAGRAGVARPGLDHPRAGGGDDPRQRAQPDVLPPPRRDRRLDAAGDRAARARHRVPRLDLRLRRRVRLPLHRLPDPVEPLPRRR